MSYSFRLPEEEPECECKYDEVRDRMDREDCHFHHDLVDYPGPLALFLRESVECKTMQKNQEVGMTVRYDPEVDVLSILLSVAPVAESDEDKPGVILDYDKDGNVVGLGILDASKRMGESYVGGVHDHTMSTQNRSGRPPFRCDAVG